MLQAKGGFITGFSIGKNYNDHVVPMTTVGGDTEVVVHYIDMDYWKLYKICRASRRRVGRVE